MEVQYTEKIKKYFIDKRKLEIIIGKDMAVKTKAIINFLLLSENFYEYCYVLRYGKPHHLSGGCFAICINQNYRLIIEPQINNLDSNHLKECTCIIIKEVADYHGGKINRIIP